MDLPNLSQSITKPIGGHDFTFHQISSVSWFNHVVIESDDDEDKPFKELLIENNDFHNRVIAASLLGDSMDKELFEKNKAWADKQPSCYTDEMWQIVGELNGLIEQAPKDSQDSPSPESSSEN